MSKHVDLSLHVTPRSLSTTELFGTTQNTVSKDTTWQTLLTGERGIDTDNMQHKWGGDNGGDLRSWNNG